MSPLADYESSLFRILTDPNEITRVKRDAEREFVRRVEPYGLTPTRQARARWWG